MSAQLTSLEATRNLLDVSVTERQSFRSCRRAWILGTIENLQHRGEPTWHFEFGTIIHAILERWTWEGDSLPVLAHGMLEAWYENMRTKYDELSPDTIAELEELCNLGEAMMEYYAQWNRVSEVQLGRVLAVEGRWVDGARDRWRAATPPGYEHADVILHESGRLLIPIIDPDSLAEDKRLTRIIGDEVYYPMLSARLDLITERRTPKRGMWVVDRKTASSARTDQALDFDDQITGYCYASFRLTGVIPRGAVIDELLKNMVQAPRWVQRGTVLSAARDQRTLAHMYREALDEEGLIRSGIITSTRHRECYEALLARGWDPFYRRYEVTRTAEELQAFEHQLVVEYEEMAEVLAVPAKQYPNKNPYGDCKRCGLRELCRAMDDGSDADYLRKSLYVVGEDRKAAA